MVGFASTRDNPQTSSGAVRLPRRELSPPVPLKKRLGFSTCAVGETFREGKTMSIVPERVRRRDFCSQRPSARWPWAWCVPVAAEDHEAGHTCSSSASRRSSSHTCRCSTVSRGEFMSPHRYQVILEAGFTAEQLNSYVKIGRFTPCGSYAGAGAVGAEPAVHTGRGAADLFHRGPVSRSPGEHEVRVSGLRSQREDRPSRACAPADPRASKPACSSICARARKEIWHMRFSRHPISTRSCR